MKHLYFVRHGESQLNAEGIYSGQTDTPLTDKGRQQAAAAGQQAADLQIDLIVASPLVRALETAQIIGDTIGYPRDKIIVKKVFQERWLASLQGQPWSVGPEDEALFPDIESFADLKQRAQAGLDWLRQQPADTILLASHGSLGLALLSLLKPDQQFDEPRNAHITQFI